MRYSMNQKDLFILKSFLDGGHQKLNNHNIQDRNSQKVSKATFLALLRVRKLRVNILN